MNIDLSTLLLEGLTISFCFAAISVRFGHWLELYSPVDFRRKPRWRVPLSGGFGIVLSVLYLYFRYQAEVIDTVLIASIPLVAAAVVDDVFELRARWKLLAQVASAVLFVTLLGHSPIDQSLWSIFWLVALCNAFNFIDGIDGQGGVTGLVTTAAMGLLLQVPPETVLTLLLPIVGFLAFNLPLRHAKVYLGDTGISWMAFSFGALSVNYCPPDHRVFAHVGIMMVAAFPLVDLLICSVRRVLAGQSPFAGDRDHLHHKLQRIGLNRRQTLVVTTLVSLYAATCSYLYWHTPPPLHLVSLGLGIVPLVSVLALIFTLEYKLSLQMLRIVHGLLKQNIPIRNTGISQANEFWVEFAYWPYCKELHARHFDFAHEFATEMAKIFAARKNQLIRCDVDKFKVVLVFDQAVNGAAAFESLRMDLESLIQEYEIALSNLAIPHGLTCHERSREPLDIVA